MQLSQIIIQNIKKNGPISFRDFMEMALYYPEMGYYTSENEKFGKQGDYYTGPVLTSLYGQMLGRQLEEMWCIMDKNPMTIVEYGAGTGALCFDILSYLKKNAALYQHLKYYIIERSEAMKQREKKVLHEKVVWIDDINEISGISGCILSNELIDNFSVNLVIMKDELMEVFVDYKDEFVEVLCPASKEIENYLEVQNISLPKGYRTEINLQALDWIKEIASNLVRGFVITIDYGFLSHELYAADRNTGTLACYYKHGVTDLPFCNIGQQDITAHVNFSALNTWGKKYGLQCTGFCNKNYFLRSLGLANYLRDLEIEDELNNKDFYFHLNKLLLEMGSKFKVLIQQKGIKPNALSGMQFSRQVF